MINFIEGRLGHSLDAFVVAGDQCRLKQIHDECRIHTEHAGNGISKCSDVDLLAYQKKATLRNRVALLLEAAPHHAKGTATHELTLNSEEARQVVHGAWQAHQSDRFWNTLDAEEELDFPFEELNPSIVDHLVSGKCTIQPDFRTGHVRELLQKVLPTCEKGGVFERTARSRRASDSCHLIAIFGGAVPTEAQLMNCDGDLSLTNIIDCRCRLAASSPRAAVEDLEVNKDLFVIPVKDTLSQWITIDAAGGPDARAFHASTVIYADLVTPILCVIGGFGSGRRLMDMTLHMMPLVQIDDEYTWFTLETAGPQPGPRYGHTMGQVGQWLTIFGGTNGSEIMNDLWALNIDTGMFQEASVRSANMWTRVQTSVGPLPPPRCFHAAVKIGLHAANPIIVYGGVSNDETSRAYSLRTDKFGDFRWNILPITVKGPMEKRAFHSMAYCDGQVVITGGEDFTSPTPTVNQCLVYYINAREFQYTEEALPLTGHRSTVIDGAMYHFGGLRSVASRVYLEPIAGPKGFDEALHIRATIEQQCMMEILTELENKNKDKDAAPVAPGGVDWEARRAELLDAGKDSPLPSTRELAAGKSSRPMRQAAKKCAEKIVEEMAKTVAANAHN
ncbi:serine/threonine-protein phosphatase [Babesia caballi]|uniref:Serine/threonine-protein phosphatase n=1 Tax=Babesia caballi TaxID=5871 RepID=A0AAV4LYS2_BABCB|nr:serine/threonine-protein phosphatase [Babesia caballi]